MQIAISDLFSCFSLLFPRTPFFFYGPCRKFVRQVAHIVNRDDRFFFSPARLPFLMLIRIPIILPLPFRPCPSGHDLLFELSPRALVAYDPSLSFFEVGRLKDIVGESW